MLPRDTQSKSNHHELAADGRAFISTPLESNTLHVDNLTLTFQGGSDGGGDKGANWESEA